ncbi:hypothetical protein THRCLA_10686 [Thraustotheca clavata]|uniref:Uncharacterized protein n=1 Tax=Thraustotheca clavata TaxID=74557 RepID=A0A1V9YID5_9STRA|nr:hypothetical protein THRCLA_10686 [Thraustotheca clavata]
MIKDCHDIKDGMNRIGKWDDKRQMCYNCKHVYLKCLSTTPNYCSVDCKSNALYLENLNKTMKILKQMKNKDNSAQNSITKIVNFEDKPNIIVASDYTKKQYEMMEETFELSTSCEQAQTFAEFHTEKLPCRPVEWAFSALY